MEQPRTACIAEECRVGPSSAGKGWGRHPRTVCGAPRTVTVCGAEECRGVPRSAEWDRVVPGRGGADIGVPLNYFTTIAIPLK